MQSEIDGIIDQALRSFVDYIIATGWYGREREAVSLFAFSHLMKFCKPGTALSEPGQIGIEVAVPQLDRETATRISGRQNCKPQVCKDLVIWPEANMTCWDETGKPTVLPAAILEWKYNEKHPSTADHSWLAAYTTKYPDVLGYSIWVPDTEAFSLVCSRFCNGTGQLQWCYLPD